MEWLRGMYCMRHIQNFVYKFRHMQAYCGIYWTLCYSCIFRILAYLEPEIYSLLCKEYSGIFRTLCNARILRTLPYLKHCHIQNFCMFRTPGIFRILLIFAYSCIFSNDSYSNIKFLFSLSCFILFNEI